MVTSRKPKRNANQLFIKRSNIIVYQKYPKPKPYISSELTNDQRAKLMQFIFKNGVDYILPGWNLTLLWMAVVFRDPPLLKFLLTHGASVWMRMENHYRGQLPIHISSDPEITECLVLHDPSLANAKDDRGFTPLYYAILFKNFRTIQLLLESGADPTIKTPMNKKLYSLRPYNTIFICTILRCTQHRFRDSFWYQDTLTDTDDYSSSSDDEY